MGMLYYKFGVIWSGFQWIALFMLLEFSVMTSMVLLFSLANSLITCFSLSFLFVLLASMAEHVKHLVLETGIPLLGYITDILYWFIPNLGNFNIKYKILKDLTISYSFAFSALGYAIFYLLFLLALGSYVLKQKDL